MGAETAVAEDGKDVVGEERVVEPDAVPFDVSGEAGMEAELLEEQEDPGEAEAVDDAQEPRREAGKGAAEDAVLAETKVEREGTRTQVPLELDELVLCPSVHRVILPCPSARPAPIHRATPSFSPASTSDRLATVVEVAELAEPEPGHSQSIFAARDVAPAAPHVPPATEEELCGAVFASPSIANAKWTTEPATPPQPRVLPTNLLVRKGRMLPFSGSAAVGPPASPSPPSRRCRERRPTLSVAGPPSPPARHDHPGTRLVRDSEGLGGAEVEEKENGVDQKGKGRAEVSGTAAARARAFLPSTPLTGLSTSNAGAGLGLSASTLLLRIDERPAYERRRIHGQLGALVGEAESASRDELSFVHFHAAMLPRPFGQPLAGEDEET
ncbi:hypothetical protein B0H16DRAFT_1722314 [Mycena metata]|uniref:Uncharacterized protein n=1 Tax=Mycena metata TaxID=1033252 RepID=A0AAD7J4T5_9AGAR|nr:hypothetical protein B0H16DRAFT_1722314 [Mycena metata]